jgi:hypothetical protein
MAVPSLYTIHVYKSAVQTTRLDNTLQNVSTHLMGLSEYINTYNSAYFSEERLKTRKRLPEHMTQQLICVRTSVNLKFF